VAVVAALGACKSDRHASTSSAAAATSAPLATPAAPAPRVPLTRPLLWSAQKAGNTTYFLGTMHIGVEAEALPATVWRALRDARTFAMEADLDDPGAAAVLAPTARSLRSDLGEAYWRKLEEALGASTAAALDHMPPLVPVTQLSLRGLPRTAAMDRTLAARAAGDRKPIVYLEPTTRQLAVLDKWMNIKALKMMLDELPEAEQHSRAMLEAYIAGDERRIVAINDSEKADALEHGYTAAEYDQEMNELLYERSASWIPAIERLHGEGGGFVAVGAMHLVGPRSVLDLLARNGYRITRIAEPHRDTTGAREPASHATP
jgi:uncharacterized protein YbaP (TraB family)